MPARLCLSVEGTLEWKEEATTSKVTQEKDSEHEGTFENKEDTIAGRCDITILVFDGEDTVSVSMKYESNTIPVFYGEVQYVEKTNNDVSEIQEV